LGQRVKIGDSTFYAATATPDWSLFAGVALEGWLG
jgi:hypothetical protein